MMLLLFLPKNFPIQGSDILTVCCVIAGELPDASSRGFTTNINSDASTSTSQRTFCVAYLRVFLYSLSFMIVAPKQCFLAVIVAAQGSAPYTCSRPVATSRGRRQAHARGTQLSSVFQSFYRSFCLIHIRIHIIDPCFSYSATPVNTKNTYNKI